jgi:RNA polymerase sigma-70 factor (ECF subfamily)
MVVISPRKNPPFLRLVSKDTRGELAPGDRPPGADKALDSSLIAAVRRGEPGSAAALHDRVRPQVDRTLRRLLGREDNDHQDLAQTTLIELIYTIGKYRGDCSLDTWTSTLTAHIVYNHLRRRHTERQLFAAILDPEDFPTASGAHTGREAMGRSAVKRVAAHLDKIEPTRAWTFLLHDAFGYDLREVAQITGASVSAAQTRLIRGRRELHQRLEQDPELADTLEELEGWS